RLSGDHRTLRLSHDRLHRARQAGHACAPQLSRPRGYRRRNAAVHSSAHVVGGADGLGRPTLLGAVDHGLRLPLHLVHGPRLRQSGCDAPHPGFCRQPVRALSNQRAANGGRAQIPRLQWRASARARAPRGRARATGAVAAEMAGISPPPATVQASAIQAAGPTSGPTERVAATWPRAVIAWRVAVIAWPIIAWPIAVIAPRAVDVIGPPPASRPMAHVAHALTEREIARCGSEIAHRHRRCRARRDAAERGGSDQTDGKSSHGAPPSLLLHGVKRALSLPRFGLPGKIGPARPRLGP